MFCVTMTTTATTLKLYFESSPPSKATKAHGCSALLYRKLPVFAFHLSAQRNAVRVRHISKILCSKAARTCRASCKASAQSPESARTRVHVIHKSTARLSIPLQDVAV